jgi:hypothetical protein
MHSLRTLIHTSIIAHHLSVVRKKGKFMNIEEIIHAWKSGEEAVEPHLPASPVGQVLSDEELLGIDGSDGIFCRITCWLSITGSCDLSI